MRRLTRDTPKTQDRSDYHPSPAINCAQDLPLFRGYHRELLRRLDIQVVRNSLRRRALGPLNTPKNARRRFGCHSKRTPKLQSSG